MPTTYDYNSSGWKRDVSEMFQLVQANAPEFIRNLAVGMPATNSKHEWQDFQTSMISMPLTNSATTGTTLTVTSSASLRVGMEIMPYVISTGVPTYEKILITGISGGTLTVTRGYRSTSTVSVSTLNNFKVVGIPKAENSAGTLETVNAPTFDYNYTMILDKYFQLSGTSQNTGSYNPSNSLAFQVQNKLTELRANINQNLIFGNRTNGASGTSRECGGVLEFLATGNTVAVGGAITQSLIDDGYESIHGAGGNSNNYRMLIHPTNMRVISGFNTAGSNPSTIINQGSKVTGGATTSLESRLDNYGNSFIMDANMAKDKIALIDMNRVKLIYLQNRELVLLEPDKTNDGLSQRVLSEFTLEVKDATTAHCLFTGIS